MALDQSAFAYLKPTDRQMGDMGDARIAFAELAQKLSILLPDGPDKTHVLRVLRDAAMWANVAITRHADGAPRVEVIDDIGGPDKPRYPADHPAPSDLGSVPL